MRILFVCSGNTCRSPMAAALAVSKFGNRASVRSAGVDCGSGIPAARNAVTVMAERGLDISNHTSTDLEDLDVDGFDIVVAMAPTIAARLAKLHPKCLEQWNVVDPYGGDLAKYRTTADAIERALDELNV